MKICLVFCIFLICLSFSLNAQSVEIAAGQNFIPGDYLSLRYETSDDYTLTWSLKAFYEKATLRSLNYSTFGLDLLGVYPLNKLRFGLGPTLQLEKEPWVYNGWDLSQRLNFGLCTEAAFQWDLSQNLSLNFFAEQKFLLKSALGNTHFLCALGIKYSFGN